MKDVFTAERRAWLAGNRRSAPNDKARMQAKFDAARVAMGDKYCCHPSRRVQRLDAPVPRSWTSLRPSPELQAVIDRVHDNAMRNFRRVVRPFDPRDLNMIRLFPES